MMSAKNSLGKFIAEMKANASGWKINSVDPEICSSKQIYIYIYDSSLEFVWTASVPDEVFRKTAKFGRESNPVKEIRDGFGSAIYEFAKTGAIKCGELIDSESMLALAASMYCGTTKAWELAEKNTDKVLHFIVISYRNAHNKDCLLRPFFSMDTQDIVMPVEALLGAVNQVMSMDKRNHPEWF